MLWNEYTFILRFKKEEESVPLSSSKGPYSTKRASAGLTSASTISTRKAGPIWKKQQYL